MSELQLHPSALDHAIPGLVGHAAVVVLFPATTDLAWAGAMAWRIARAMAATGRRTALVDCFVQDPVLHGIAGASNDEGMVDAFEYGASLARIVQAQPEPNLFFISAGTYAANPQPLMTHPRWRRLSAGFRHEEALLLLFAGDDALAGLAAEPDGMIVLAPQGMDLAVADWPALAEAVGNGQPPLLAVIAEESAPVEAAVQPAGEAPGSGERGAGPAASDGLSAPARPILRPRTGVPMGMLLPKRSTPWGMIAALLAIAAGGALGWVFRADLQRIAGLTPTPPPADTAPALAPPPLPPVESLPWAVQVSAWTQPGDAFAAADTLEHAGIATIVTPIRLQGRVWWRVYAGPFPRETEAESLLAALRSGGTIAAETGATIALPLSFALPGSYTPGRAQTERMRLRAAGVPSFVLGQVDGSYRLFSGAFDGTSPAVLLQTLLTPIGGAAQLAPRTGFVP